LCRRVLADQEGVWLNDAHDATPSPRLYPGRTPRNSIANPTILDKRLQRRPAHRA
jgi:hypothetical protein